MLPTAHWEINLDPAKAIFGPKLKLALAGSNLPSFWGSRAEQPTEPVKKFEVQVHTKACGAKKESGLGQGGGHET